MKTKLLTICLLLFTSQAFAGKVEMERACESIPGVDECKMMNGFSFWVIMSNSSQNHNYPEYGSLLCHGGQQKFGVKKGYSITFWSRSQRELGKYRCF